MYLRILVSKTVSRNIEWIASCLGSIVENFVSPLDASKCVEMAMRDANEIGSDDCVQLGGGPQGALFVRDVQFVTKISSNPLC